MKQERLRERIAAAGLKRIPACDGGGIRGLMTVEILANIEADLRAAAYAKKCVDAIDHFSGF